MEIVYSKHAEHRLRIRGIPFDLPAKMVEEAEERFFDTETGHLIAVKRTELYGKIRDVMVAYLQEMETFTVLTIHPLKEGQKENRLKIGRWRKIQ